MYDFGTRLDTFLKKVGLTQAQFEKEFDAETKRFEDSGSTPNPEVIFRIIRGRYTSSRKSNAMQYTGYFIGIDRENDFEKKVYDKRMETKTALIKAYKDKWVEEGIKLGKFNSDGEPIHDAESTKLQWMVGKKVEETLPIRNMWGVFTDEAGNTNGMVINCDRPATFVPVPGKMYTFRSSPHKDTPLWKTYTSAVSRLIETGETVDYETAVDEIDTYFNDHVRCFEDIYDINQLTINDIGLAKDMNFSANIVMINSYSVTKTDYHSDYVEVVDLNEDYDENVSMSVEKVLDFDIKEGAVGIIVFTPFFVNDKETNTKSRVGGRVCGFIPNDKLTPTVDITPITDDDTGLVDNFD